MTDVAVFTLDIAGAEAGEIAALATFLDAAEQARAERFMFDNDRRAYIAAHALLRAMLTARLGRPPASWRFEVAAHGKPFLVDAPRDLRVSLSHTRGHVAAAIAEAVEVGVDIEGAGAARDALRLAERYFAPDECAALRALTTEQRSDAFVRIWTLKEAAIKVVGDGIAAGLDRFVVDLARPRVTPPSSMSLSVEHWRLGDFHLAAACAATGAAFALQQSAPPALIRAMAGG